MTDTEKFKDICNNLHGNTHQHPQSRILMCKFTGGVMSYDPILSEANLKFSPKKTMVIHNIHSMLPTDEGVEIITVMKNKFRISKEKFTGEVF